ncbi:nuclear transport factor 2 family protein [Actinocrispum sp. NPDC049592]|uniref:Rv0361 family membrane protein n=1 Tax=Actinocrispum sp. NPDC049592 TaxID=3154835 RepID=UPI00341F4720
MPATADSAAEGDQPTESPSPASEGEQPTETGDGDGDGDKPSETGDGDKPTEALPAVSPPTRKSSTRLLIAIGLAVLVLVGGGITIIALATQNRPEDLALQKSKAEARGVVEKFAVLFAQARNDGAFSLSKSDVKALLCSREQDALDQEWTERETKEINRSSAPPTPAARLELTIKDINIQGDVGVATLTGTIADRKTDQDFGLVKEQGLWKVCDVVFRIPRSSSSSNPTTPSDVGTNTTEPEFPTSPVGENPGTTITTTTTETQ